MALALPAASVPQTIVQKTVTPQAPTWMPGTSRVARTMAGTVVTSRSSMIRGFVSATYARSVSLSGRSLVSADVDASARRPASGPGVAPAPTRAS